VHPEVELATGSGEEGEKASWDPEKILNALDISMNLETEQLTVTEGLLRINEYSAPFNISLRDLDCRIGYSDGPRGYSIFLSYKQSRLLYKERDIVHDLTVEAELTRQGIEIKNIEFRHNESSLRGTGSMPGWDSPVLHLDMAGEVSASDLILADASLNEGRGMVDVHTIVRYDGEGIYLKGDFIASNGSYRNMGYSDLSGNLEIVHDILYLTNVAGNIGGGSISAEGKIPLKSSVNTPNRLSILSDRVPLYEVGNLLNIDSIQYRNVVDAKTVLEWGGGRDTTIDCDAYLHGDQRAASDGLKSTPLGGNAKFYYYGGGRIELYSVNLRSAATEVNANGGKDELFHVQLDTSRLSEPFNLIANFSPPVEKLMMRYPDLQEMKGDFSFKGDTRVRSSSDIQYKGSISVRNGRWRTIEVDSLYAEADLEGAGLNFRNLDVRRGAQSVKGDLSLDFADEESLSGFGFRGDFQNIQLALLKDLDLSTLDVAGSVNGSGNIRFDQGGWICEGLLTVESGRVQEEVFDRLDAHINVLDGRVYFENTKIIRDGTSLTVNGSIDPGTLQLDFDTHLDQLPLGEIPVFREKASLLRGYVNASGFLKGNLNSPEFSGAFEIVNLGYDAWDLGNGEGKLEFKENALTGNAGIRSDFGRLSVNARISGAEGYPGEMTLVFNELNIRKIFAGKALPYLDIDSTELNGSISGKGNFDDFNSILFRGEVDGALFRINDYELSNFGKVEFSIEDNKLSFDTARIRGAGTDLFLKGILPLDDGKLDMNLNGGINMVILSGLQENLTTSGNAVVDIRVTGSRQDPDIVGRLSFISAEFEHTDVPFPVSNVQGDVLFSANVVRLENIQGKASSGTFTLSGAYEHSNMVMRSISMDLSVQEVRLQYPKDFNSLVNADLQLRGDREVQVLTGEIDVLRSEYIRDFNLLERLAQSGSTTSGKFAAEPSLQNLRLNLELRSNNGLIIDNELARVRGSMRLNLRGTPAYPVLTGRVEAVDGTIFFRGNRFEISHAYANFIDRNRINPVLDIRAEADVRTYRLILDATGTLDNPSVNITSDPPMSMVDIISLLTTGVAETDGQTPLHQSQVVGMGAASVLSENLTGALGRRVQRIFGLESFRVDPYLAGTEKNPTARITISERIYRDMVITYSQNLSTNEEQVVIIEYDVGKGVSIVASRDEDGRYGIDFRLRKRFK